MYARSRLPEIRRYEALLRKLVEPVLPKLTEEDMERGIPIQGWLLKYDKKAERCYWEKALSQEDK